MYMYISIKLLVFHAMTMCRWKPMEKTKTILNIDERNQERNAMRHDQPTEQPSEWTKNHL